MAGSYRFWELMGEYDAEGASYSALAGGGGSSPYTPGFSGRLVGLRVIVSREAATTKTNHVVIKLTSTSFTPNSFEVGAEGPGLQTAPAFPAPVYEWPVNQPVVSGRKIEMEGKCPGAETSVTNEVYLYGLFEI